MGVDVLQDLRTAITEFDTDAALAATRQAIDGRANPLDILAAVTAGMKEIGDGYANGELWLPELVGAASVVQKVMPLIEANILETGTAKQSQGSVVIGTVSGDIHTIGKGMVSSLLIAAGFEVHDLGTDTPTATFVDAVQTYHPDVVAMSALLSVTAPEAKKVIDALEQAGVRESVKVIVGGGAITEEYATRVGADGYAASAPEAVDLVRALLDRTQA